MKKIRVGRNIVATHEAPSGMGGLFDVHLTGNSKANGAEVLVEVVVIKRNSRGLSWHGLHGARVPAQTLQKRMKVRKTQCATCPFRKGSEYADLAPYLAERSLEETRFCHSTGTNAIGGETGRPELVCRGSRDIQLKVYAGIGFIQAPTDAAWEKKWREICEGSETDHQGKG